MDIQLEKIVNSLAWPLLTKLHPQNPKQIQHLSTPRMIINSDRFRIRGAATNFYLARFAGPKTSYARFV